MENIPHEKESVALSSVLASLVLTLMKLIVGLLTGSLGILSEAAHSLLDFAAATLTYFAVRVSDRPVDESHPYGHAKIESVSALIATGLLFVTSAWIIKEAVDRLRAAEIQVETTWYAIAVIVVAMGIDFFRARALSRVAKATKSQALEADALHFSSDILSSAVVLLGLGLVYFGYPKADAIAAMGVALFICHAGYSLGRRTVDILIDTAPEGIAEQVATLVIPIPGVARIDRIRVRPAGKTIFLDLIISIGRTLSMPQARAISSEVVARIHTALPDADVLVHTQPLALDNETIADQVRLIAAGHNVAAHHIMVNRIEGRICVSFELEVDGTLSIREAHTIASTVEAAIRAEIGEEVLVESHLDPRVADLVEEAHPVNPERLVAITAALLQQARKAPELIDVHNIQVRAVSSGLHIAFHCRFQDDALLEQVHDTVNRLEHRLYEQLPEAQRILIHAEPARHVD